MENLEIREFQQAIINFANQSHLPVEVKRLALREVMAQLQEAADGAVQAELMQRQNEEEKSDGTEQGIQQNQLGEQPQHKNGAE